jgi:hypothetical protein
VVDDIGETTDLAAQHSETVKRLQALVAKMDADLGLSGLGPGVRPPGRVEHPHPLLAENEPAENAETTAGDLPAKAQ